MESCLIMKGGQLKTSLEKGPVGEMAKYGDFE